MTTQTSVIGYPRIGGKRELKFATEKFFKGDLDEAGLLAAAADIRRTNLLLQKAAGVSFIPSNDFSFYDGVLDAAVLTNIVPARYRELGLSELGTYFAMARGYQGPNGDVKALAMKKWFNTNYHYLVPEIGDETEVRLSGEKPLAEYKEALALGVETKPVVLGAFTLLKLLRYQGQKTAADFAPAFIKAYSDLLAKANGLGVKWLQFDEPFLVRDLTEADLELFKQIYSALLSVKSNVKVLLQTYFGDIRDGYESIVKLDFDAIGLDFVEGKETANLVEKFGFPKGKLLVAGIVNGKNIWKNSYEKSLKLLDGLGAKGIEVAIGTSCSLLHVPNSLKYEQKLPENVKAHFAFAEEKLVELAELKAIFDAENRAGLEAYSKNLKLFADGRDALDLAVSERVNKIKESDFVRNPPFAEREKIQKERFNLPQFPTTTIGSFPQTADVKANRNAYRKGLISKQEYEEFNRKKIAECIKLQEEIGLDVLVHGEYERNDMVEYFGEHLKGCLFTENAWVQSYGTRCVKPPIIWGDISRTAPITVAWSVYAQGLTEKPLKGMLTGPVTILNWSFPREDIPLRESAFQIALAIRDEVLDLEANGIKIIQVDEAALREKLPLRKADWQSEYLDWAISAFRLVHSGVRPETQIHTHMCYSEFTDIIPAIDRMDADVITFEASRSDLQILDSLKENNFKTEVGPGVYDIHSPRVPSVGEILEALGKMVLKVEPSKLWVNPDCGLKTRGPSETRRSLENLVAAAKEFRKSQG